MRSPDSHTSPAVGESRPASNDSSVVLPEPEAPTMATVSPGATARLAPRRIRSGGASAPSRLVISLRTSLASTACSTTAFMRRLLFVVLLVGLGAAHASGPAAAPVILVWGDSLSSAYGM